jgi:hypothetical protein
MDTQYILTDDQNGKSTNCLANAQIASKHQKQFENIGNGKIWLTNNEEGLQLQKGP